MVVDFYHVPPPFYLGRHCDKFTTNLGWWIFTMYPSPHLPRKTLAGALAKLK